MTNASPTLISPFATCQRTEPNFARCQDYRCVCPRFISLQRLVPELGFQVSTGIHLISVCQVGCGSDIRMWLRHQARTTSRTIPNRRGAKNCSGGNRTEEPFLYPPLHTSAKLCHATLGLLLKALKLVGSKLGIVSTALFLAKQGLGINLRTVGKKERAACGRLNFTGCAEARKSYNLILAIYKSIGTAEVTTP